MKVEKGTGGRVLLTSEAYPEMGGVESLDPEEVRVLIDELRAALPVERDEDGNLVCPKCGCLADYDERGKFHYCPQTECDGYAQTIKEEADDEGTRGPVQSGDRRGRGVVKGARRAVRKGRR